MRIEWRTDKPPDEIERYLITDQSGDIDLAKWSDAYATKDGIVRTGKYRWIRKIPESIPVAWMPAPTPYKPDKTQAIAEFIENATEEELPMETYEKLWEIIDDRWYDVPGKRV